MRCRGVLAAAGSVLALAAPGAPALADPSPQRELLQIGSAAERDCDGRPLAGSAPGVAARSWTAPADGWAEARLLGDQAPDWDLAVFRGGELIASSTNFGSLELAAGAVDAGDEVHVQACRREGGRVQVPLTLAFTAVPDVPPSTERISIESVAIRGGADIDRLTALGFDVTENAGPHAVDVVLYSDNEREQLSAGGFAATTQVADLGAKARAARERESRATGRSALPSGRDTYRQYTDFTDELKDLAEENPSFVREVTIGTSLEGRPIQGVEIAADVAATGDGRPVYLNFGVHHAREWPSGEFPMEFAISLVDGFHAGNPRIVSLLSQVRTVIVPVVNPDGFVASRSHDPAAAGAYRRKNCRPNGDAATPCPLRSTDSGVDLNRNYGAYWGGVGSSNTKGAETYRGPAPFSEPESEAVHQYTAKLQPTVFITNHTYTTDGEWLRQPGFDNLFDFTPDEDAMADLGAAMAGATGWSSLYGYQLGYEVTGATEDWNYFAQGTYGYTPEARGNDFHPGYANAVVREFLGDASHPGQGVREAYLLAGERAANAADHSVLEGTGPPGATLRIRKEFVTPTSRAGVQVNDVLTSQLTVPASGHYEWHVNPSSRPDVDPGSGRTPPLETWAMTCTPAGGPASAPSQISVDRGERVTVDWGQACVPPGPGPGPGPVPGPDPGPGPLPAATPPPADCFGSAATIAGTAGPDKLRGTPGTDVIAGLAGNDRISGLSGDDVLCGGPGRDKLKGGGGIDILVGGGSRDRCLGGPGRDLLRSCP